MTEKKRKSMSDIITDLLREKGREGAPLSEIYARVRAESRGRILDTSVRAILYKRLFGSDSGYTPRFDRIVKSGQVRYRLLA